MKKEIKFNECSVEEIKSIVSNYKLKDEFSGSVIFYENEIYLEVEQKWINEYCIEVVFAIVEEKQFTKITLQSIIDSYNINYDDAKQLAEIFDFELITKYYDSKRLC